MKLVDALVAVGSATTMLLLAYYLPRTCGTYDSGVGQAADVTPSSTNAAVTERSLSLRSPVLHSTEADARLSGQVDQAGTATGHGSPTADHGAPSEARDAGVNPALAASQLHDYPDSFLPTEEGLIDATLGLWLNEDFLALTQDEAHELLALDDTMGMKGPDSMMAIVGPLPTEGDCRIGFRSPAVQAALQEVCAYEIAIAELGSVPIARRCAGSQERIETLIALRDSARSVLMCELDKATTFGAWRLWERLYARWSR